jgi:hypothetical protein
MAKTTKRINGDYDLITNDGTTGTVLIDSGTVTINGNLNVTGTQTTVSTTDTAVTDNTLILNSGESGAVVTSGTAGIEIDRGTSDNATWQFNETDDTFDAKLGSAYINIQALDPTAAAHVATKSYVDAQVGGGGAVVDKINEGDSKLEIIDAGADIKLFLELDATQVMEVTSTTLSYANVSISGNTVSNSATNEDLILATTGTGEVKTAEVLTLTEQGSNPTAQAGETRLYAKTPGDGGSGMFVANQDTTDELVTKSKAIAFGLIF